MYLVSIYFDEKTNKQIQRYINKIAEVTANQYMIEGNVPPHITISAFETANEGQAIESFHTIAKQLQRGELMWASVGQFLPYVMYIAPVLNRYLHDMSTKVYETFLKVEGVKISPYYQPFQWLPHTTVGKKLSKEEMQVAFQIMQDSFGAFEGQVVRIGLAKPNPHRDIASWELN